MGSLQTVISVEDVNRQARIIKTTISQGRIGELAHKEPYVSIENLNAGYGKMAILHDFNLQVAKGQSLCLIGPNGAGKSIILHSNFGFTDIYSGCILIGENETKNDVTALSSSEKFKNAGIAYILQDKSVFPNMTVERTCG